ncbi:hypothetical protein F8271_18750 [Micromonospora sp. ALFpr18c]|uniref:hypothetical protein n=1 Tax=unclassified Micromonospora TaxID=2617518 RepID=UPI00124B58F7|nr:hypothetical protein [Micromonospora sp. ALFpr18c]KAB1937682.1 hypothetical protein F8271_18750 [Micromonospora sp. ALFpr18c]
MKITSTAEEVADGSRFGRDHAKSAVLAVAGLILLISARWMPWVTVRPNEFAADRLFGRVPSTEARTFGLTDLAGYWQPLYVGWAALLVLLVAAWVRPQWRFGVRLAAILLGVVLGVGTLLPATAAIDVSGYPSDDHPNADLLGGVWSALFGMLLLVRAVTALKPSTPTASEPTAPAAAAAVFVDEPATADSTSFVWQGSRPNTRPDAPWWRRPAPIAGVLAVLGVAVLVVTVSWRAIDSADDQTPDLGALVVAAPAGWAPATPAVAHDQADLDLGRVLPLSEARAHLLAEQAGGDLIHAAASAWTRPDATLVSITLLEFGSAGSADQFQRSYSDLREATPGEVTPLADVPGSAVFVNAERTGVWAVAGRHEVVLIVSAVGGPPGSVPVVESLVREQYDRL